MYYVSVGQKTLKRKLLVAFFTLIITHQDSCRQEFRFSLTLCHLYIFPVASQSAVDLSNEFHVVKQ